MPVGCSSLLSSLALLARKARSTANDISLCSAASAAVSTLAVNLFLDSWLSSPGCCAPGVTVAPCLPVFVSGFAVVVLGPPLCSASTRGASTLSAAATCTPCIHDYTCTWRLQQDTDSSCWRRWPRWTSWLASEASKRTSSRTHLARRSRASMICFILVSLPASADMPVPEPGE